MRLLVDFSVFNMILKQAVWSKPLKHNEIKTSFRKNASYLMIHSVRWSLHPKPYDNSDLCIQTLTETRLFTLSFKFSFLLVVCFWNKALSLHTFSSTHQGLAPKQEVRHNKHPYQMNISTDPKTNTKMCVCVCAVHWLSVSAFVAFDCLCDVI